MQNFYIKEKTATTGHIRFFYDAECFVSLHGSVFTSHQWTLKLWHLCCTALNFSGCVNFIGCKHSFYCNFFLLFVVFNMYFCLKHTPKTSKYSKYLKQLFAVFFCFVSLWRILMNVSKCKYLDSFKFTKSL